ncbi:MAG: hypothetical protein GXO11_08340 [Epsilonproteobacteria bacterium]|nr:hypothetical protein [Campylobacterota bacterium]
MKKERSVFNVVTTHILTTSVVIPFFGLLIGYMINKSLSTTLNQTEVLLIKDIVFIIFFFFGVRYSLSYIDKTITVKDPKNSLRFSLIVFGLLMVMIFFLNVLAYPNTLNTIYNIAFFGIIFILFYIPTKRYFTNLLSTLP